MHSAGMQLQMGSVHLEECWRCSCGRQTLELLQCWASSLGSMGTAQDTGDIWKTHLLSQGSRGRNQLHTTCENTITLHEGVLRLQPVKVVLLQDAEAHGCRGPCTQRLLVSCLQHNPLHTHLHHRVNLSETANHKTLCTEQCSVA